MKTWFGIGIGIALGLLIAVSIGQATASLRRANRCMSWDVRRVKVKLFKKPKQVGKARMYAQVPLYWQPFAVDRKGEVWLRRCLLK